MRAAIATLLILAAASGLSAADLGDKRLYECPRTSQAPTIDGKLTEACWKEAASTGTFWKLKGPTEDLQQTSFQICYDEQNLYLAVTCLEKDLQGLQAEVRIEDDATVMGDDAVEIFLQPTDKDYYQFSANSLGTRYDGKAFDSSWNAKWRAAGSVDKDGWYLECAVSFQSLGRYGVPGMTWGLQVARDRNAGGQTEWSAWTPTPGGFHQPGCFGQLIFGGQAGGGDRAALIECARAAQLSLGLEERLGDALRTIRGADLKPLAAADRQKVQGKLAAGDIALKALRELLTGPGMVDTRAWYRVNGALKAAADDLDETAWLVRFEKLLAD